MAEGVEQLAAYASGYEFAMMGAGICGLIGVAASLLLSHKSKENGSIAVENS